MVRRRQSLKSSQHTTADDALTHPNDIDRQQELLQQQQQQQHDFDTTNDDDHLWPHYHSSANGRQEGYQHPLGTSTAISIPTETSPSQTYLKLSRHSGSAQGGGSGGLGGGGGSSSRGGVSGAFTTKTAKGARRSDSVSLAQAEGGSFKSADYSVPLLNGHDSPTTPRFATSFPPVRVSMTSLMRNWTSRRSLLLLLFVLAFVTLILSPTKQGSEVLHKANKALEDSWDKAETYWDDIRKNNNKHEMPPPVAHHPGFQPTIPPPPQQHPATPQDFGLGKGKVDDHEPHKIELPPMHAGGEIKEASILEAVRKKPALHTDPEKTTRCESNGGTVTDHNGKPRPVVQYVIMIDAGSTGSRVHVYKFNFCKSSPELEDEVFEMIQGGLSSYKADARGAALSLKPLMETAMKSVPPSLRASTPVAVKATAGLRLLGKELSYEILQAVRNMLELEYPFPIADGQQPGQKKGVEIMDGKDEGVFAWITVNYLLNRIGSDGEAIGKQGKPSVKTAAVMDLGGASTQIVFEPVYESQSQGMHPGEHVYELSNFGGRKYTLYQNSYLGYGLMEARKSINSLSLFTYSLTHPDSVRLAQPPSALTNADAVSLSAVQVPSPCFAEGETKKTKVRMQGSKEEIEVEMIGTPGGFDACRRLVEVMMDKDAVCKQPPCSFAGVFQPSLMTSFAQLPIVALSYFYDRLSPLGIEGTFPLSALSELTKKVCAPSSTWPNSFPQDRFPKALEELKGRPESCLDFTYLFALLSLGYELSDDRPITVAKKLGGMETSWSLGCSLLLVEEEGVISKS